MTAGAATRLLSVRASAAWDAAEGYAEFPFHDERVRIPHRTMKRELKGSVDIRQTRSFHFMSYYEGGPEPTKVESRVPGGRALIVHIEMQIFSPEDPDVKLLLEVAERLRERAE